MRYLFIWKPLVVVMCPPCAGFGHWSHLSRYIHPETWGKFRKVGECLAAFAAKVCWVRLNCGRHSLVEDLAGSELFRLACFETIWGTGACVTINAPQCALGLMVDGQPIYKNTIALVSGTILLGPFWSVCCTCRAHGALEGYLGSTPTTKFAQVWRRGMCLEIVNGIRSRIRNRRGNCLVHESDAWPVGALGPAQRPRRGRPRKDPEGIFSTEAVIYDCFACLRRLHNRHPAHTRNGEPPLLCRYYPLGPGDWSCEACLRVRPAEDPRHTLVAGCRMAGGLEVARRAEKQLGQVAGAGPCRDPATQASGVADGHPIIDDFDLDADVEDGGAFSVLGACPGDVLTKEERNGLGSYQFSS